MAGRRFQNPKPHRRGKWWCLKYWQDEWKGGKLVRTRVRQKIAPADMPVRKVQKIAAELLRPLNQGLVTVGGALKFTDYVRTEYIPGDYKVLAKSTQDRYLGVIKNYLEPTFGEVPLRDIKRSMLQKYFADMKDWELTYESKDKIRDVLASILVSARKNGFLVVNPVEDIRLPRNKKAKRVKPYVTVQQFTSLCHLIPEPYSTMVYTAVFSGLRVSELIGLRWNDVHEDAITVDERCCRGDWGAPKSEASNATIGVPLTVIDRIHNLKQLTVSVRAGRATRRYKVVKISGPEDLVFQSVRKGATMRDNNILCRYIKPAGRLVGVPFVNWRVLRRSYATWLKIAGADIKDAQAQMRHSRASTTLDIYQQFVPESQRRAVNKLTTLQ